MVDTVRIVSGLTLSICVQSGLLSLFANSLTLSICLQSGLLSFIADQRCL